MSWYWLSLLKEPPVDAFVLAAGYTPDRHLEGYLSAWETVRRRPFRALSIDERPMDPEEA